MSWRLAIADTSLCAAHWLRGEPEMIAVWVTPNEVRFYVAQSGDFYQKRHIALTGQTDDSVRAPNGAFLPVVSGGNTALWFSYDGGLRVRRLGDHQLLLEADGRQTALQWGDNQALLAIGMDRELGTIGVLDSGHMLTFFQQHAVVGAYAVEVSDMPLALFCPDAMGLAYLADPQRIQVVDMSGRVLHSVTLPQPIGICAGSPDGELVITSDQGQPIIRVYDAALMPLRQADAWDLLGSAAPAQLLADWPLSDAFMTALDVTDDGKLVFGLGGALCVTHVDQLMRLPQPRVLF